MGWRCEKKNGAMERHTETEKDSSGDWRREERGSRLKTKGEEMNVKRWFREDK